jgi:hypothetical protein
LESFVAEKKVRRSDINNVRRESASISVGRGDSSSSACGVLRKKEMERELEMEHTAFFARGRKNEQDSKKKINQKKTSFFHKTSDCLNLDAFSTVDV